MSPESYKPLRALLNANAYRSSQPYLRKPASDQTAGPTGQEVKVDAGVTAGGGVPAEAAIEGADA